MIFTFKTKKILEKINRLLAKLFGIGDFSPEQNEAKAIGS